MQLVHEALLSQDRLRLISEFGRELADAPGVEAALRVAASGVLAAHLADLSVLIVDVQDGSPRIEVGRTEPESGPDLRERISREMERLRRIANNEIRSGRRFCWIPTFDSRTARITRGHPGLSRLLEELHVSSLIVVPLRAGGKATGALALARTGTTAPFTAGDLGVAQVLARRVAMAVETVRLGAAIRHAEQRHARLEDALLKWSQVFQLAGWGAAVVDPTDRRIDTVNPAFARMHGYGKPEELTGRLFDDLLAEDAGVNDLWNPAAKGREHTYESLHRRANGDPLPVLVSVTPLAGLNGSGSYVVTVQDLSELKRTEERLRSAQRMEAVGRLAGGVAHEVNNMMTIILGFSDLLGRAEDFPDTRRRDLEEIRKAARRAANVTQQLLAFSRQQILQPSDLGTNSVVEEVLPVLRLLLPANVQVETALSPVESRVRADRAQLEQVLINLAFNARDAMPSGGVIRIVTETRRLTQEAGRRQIGIPIVEGEYALISVVDTGCGMDQLTLSKVFEPFFTTKPMGEGTGLGLATVYGIVKQSEGYVWVNSAPDQGTTFTIALPVADGQEIPETPRETTPGEALQGGSVLVVEDEDGVRELATRILEGRHWRVLAARSGADALAALRAANGEVDLVLTDVVLPDLPADELARRVREICPDLPLLYMSAYAWDDVLQRSLIQRHDPFLQKPFTAEELMEEVARLLRPRVVGG